MQIQTPRARNIDRCPRTVGWKLIFWIACRKPLRPHRQSLLEICP
jgi:hypothetical protein